MHLPAVFPVARLWRSRGGGILPMAGFVFFALIVLTGFAIDAGRFFLLHSSLQRALDAGALSAVVKMSTQDVATELEKFTTVNFASGYVGGAIDSLDYELSDDEKTLTATASASAPTTFMQLLGIETMTVSVATEIERSVGGLELVLVLDNTGSMSGTALTSLKTAANTLLGILFGDNATAENLYVGIVPFSQTVNIGTEHESWLTAGSLDALDWGTTSWGGCVEARDGYDTTDATPSAVRFDPYYFEDSSSNDWITTTTTRTGSQKGGKGTTSTTTTTTYASPLDNTTQGPNLYCPSEVTPMTSTKATLTAAVAAMQAVGNTHINFGAVWGWRMLSPKWRGLWGGDMDTYSLPLDYNSKNMSKAAVIMTDGENVMSSSIYTAYGWLSEGRLGTTSANSAKTALNSRLSTVCTAMKNAGIIVYTVAFKNPGTSTQSLLKSCATQDSFYFNSPTATELQTAFKQIGDSLSSLRVSR